MNKPVAWMDLNRQYEKYKNEFISALENVCADTAFSGGHYVSRFEKEFSAYCNAIAASGVNSGTSALFLAMKALGITEGNEVIVPANTFIATAWGVCHNGATPVFVDIHPDTFEIDASKIEAKITSKTKAIVGVHLYGQPFDVDTVRQIAQAYDLFLIEDSAQAHGALYKGKRIGCLGDIGCFSFYPSKNLGAFGEAGAVVSNNLSWIQKINRYRNQGASAKYIHETMGYNMRMDGLQGAILSCKLKYLDEWNHRRREIALEYMKKINSPRIKLQAQPAWSKSVFHLFVIEADDKKAFLQHLDANNIGYGQHYPVPCHLQPVFKELGYRTGDLPYSEYHARHCVSLPLYPELTDEEVSAIISVCNSF